MMDYHLSSKTAGTGKTILLTHGFSVTAVYLDAVNPEEKDTFYVATGTCTRTGAMTQRFSPKMRMMPRNESEVLAIGQKAAWFTGSRHFVNLVEGAGLYGFDGIRRTAELMMEKPGKKKKIQKIWSFEKDGGAKAAYETDI